MLYKSWLAPLVSLVAFSAFSEPLTWDPDVVRGQLDNGLTYILRQNAKPADRAELRLAVKAGSVLEDDDQQGLAHFLEHMAFNGTEHFAKHELVDYLESVGMRFGPDLNAYTSFDQTVYMLQSRTDKPEQLDKAFLVLRDWASAIANEGEEIDKERGVILEERRLRRGAQQRMRDQHLPVLFKGSKYAERLPIGTEEVLKAFTHERLREFFSTWYRPDLMAVIVVGDMEPAEMEALVKKHFASFGRQQEPRVRPDVPVPEHQETLVSVATDPEATETTVSVYFKKPPRAMRTLEDFRGDLVSGLVNTMLNQRLGEKAREQDAPFLSAASFEGNYLRSLGVYGLYVQAREGEALPAFKAGLEEAERARRHGFTPAEFERVKAEILRGAERAFREKDTSESGGFARDYIEAFVEDQVPVGPEGNFRLTERLLPEITLEEVNATLGTWMTEANRVILAGAPEKDGLAPPEADPLRAALDASRRQEVAAYEDTVPTTPLVKETGEPGKIVERSEVPELGLHRWKLSNGAEVLYKQTAFKKDQILMSAWSAGGDSLIAEEDLVPGQSAAGVVQECGLGDYSRVQLAKRLSGKIVSVSPYIDEFSEGFRGSCSPEDLETLFQLTRLHFTGLRRDSEAFNAMKDRAREYQKNRLREPQEQYSDMLQRTMSQDHPRRQPMNVERVEAYDMEKSLSLFAERFQRPGDFTFLFVGALEPQQLERYALTYLGSLPAGDGRETWADPGVHYPTGHVTKELHKGLEPKSRVDIVFSGSMPWTLEDRHQLRSLTKAMSIRLREVLREDLGGTYSVGAYPVLKPYPKPEFRLVISFSCDPDRVEEMLTATYGLLDVFQKEPFEAKVLDKVKEAQVRQRETEKEQNGFWLGQVQSFLWLGEDPREILTFEDRVEKVTAESLLQAAGYYLGSGNRAQFVLKPEAGPAAASKPGA